MRSFLRYSGLAPVAVSNATDALTFASEADVIVTGIVLDGPMDGVELVSRLRGDEGTMHKPIIVLTTSAWPRVQERAEHAGCNVFLSKPCLPDALLRDVRLLLPSTRCFTAKKMPRTQMTEHRRASTRSDVTATLWGVAGTRLDRPAGCFDLLDRHSAKGRKNERLSLGWYGHEVRGVSMNRDEVEGKAQALKGKIKQATGDLTNNPRLHDEGVVDEVAGKTQDAVGRVKRKVGKAIERVGTAIKK
jgi:two-component system, cell cycle response regulator DivK